ncbi:MAG: tRNA-dihydrouridine synthase [Nanoarchaeota archaeon]|nr:tRNA-dihydrouridine synthase [Nanoarchaeota archaeon]
MDFNKKVILAPMVAVNNIAFRKLCSDYGADIVYSQMIDSVGYSRGNRRLADFYDEKNVVAQFFGNDAKIISECAKDVENKVQAVDLNLGCPHSDVVKRKCGSYLMKYPKKIEGIIKALVKSLKVPVTVKIRAGYDAQHINAVKIAKLCEKEGISAITVHGRARTVNYEHSVDYDIIKKVKKAVNVPVIGNGDIFSPKDAKDMLEKSGCDSIMIGRGAMGNAAIFKDIKNYLKKGKVKEEDIGKAKKKMFLRYLRYCKKYKVSFTDIKTHAIWFTKGIKHGSEYRQRINMSKDIDELKKIYSSIS